MKKGMKRKINKRNDEWFSDNGIRVEGAKSMSEMLNANTTLTSLNLGCEEEGRMEEEKERKMMNY